MNKFNLTLCVFLALLAALVVGPSSSADPAVMEGFPPSAESQVTKANYLAAPFNRWAFRNAGAPLHGVMVPRAGNIWHFKRHGQPLASYQTAQGSDLADLFEANYADGFLVVQGDTILSEHYFGGFDGDDQHLWFSMTKSLVSALFGMLVQAGSVNLDQSPADYIPELQGSAFARVTIQQVLDHTTALDFRENYTDPESDFFRYYAPALGMIYQPGAADVSPEQEEIYGVHDFLVRFVGPAAGAEPGAAFEYNSANADVLGWLLARLMDRPLNEAISDYIWRHIGAEHDAFIAVDRAYMPVATGGFNATLRDAARFGMMVRDGGVFDGKRLLPAGWLDAMLSISNRDLGNMSDNGVYAKMPWSAYKNMWWILDASAGEFCAVGIHGQVLYINRAADAVMVWYSSQPDASAAVSPHFLVKLDAARALARYLEQGEF